MQIWKFIKILRRLPFWTGRAPNQGNGNWQEAVMGTRHPYLLHCLFWVPSLHHLLRNNVCERKHALISVINEVHVTRLLLFLRYDDDTSVCWPLPFLHRYSLHSCQRSSLLLWSTMAKVEENVTGVKTWQERPLKPDKEGSNPMKSRSKKNILSGGNSEGP